jgi:MATE family multidrug resistance protein
MPPVPYAWAAEARALGGISASVTLTMLAQLAMSAVETLVVARLGVPELAGVTLALGVQLLVFLFSLGVVTALTPLVAAARGRGHERAVRLFGQHGLWVGLTFSVPGALLLLACRDPLAALIGQGVEADSAAAYLAGAALGLPAWVAYVAARSFAVATGEVRAATFAMAAAIPVHAALTPWLTFGGAFLPPLGAFGAGLAYAVTGYVALALLVAAVRILPGGALRRVLQGPFVWDSPCYLEILRLGLPFACRIVLREGVMPAAAFLIAPFGASAIAAHGVAARIVDLCGTFSFGFSDAANARVGHALGAGARHQARHSAWIAVQLAALVGAAMAVLLLAAPLPIVRAVLGDADPADLQAVAALLPLAAGLLFLEGVMSAASGALSGLRDARGPLLIAVVGSWVIGLPAGFVLASLTAAPAIGLWCGMLAGAGITTGLYLLRLRMKLRTGHA